MQISKACGHLDLRCQVLNCMMRVYCAVCSPIDQLQTCSSHLHINSELAPLHYRVEYELLSTVGSKNFYSHINAMMKEYGTNTEQFNVIMISKF